MQHLPTNFLLQGGKYRIEKVLGQGGFGITYLATQELLDRKVCIKEFFFKDSCVRNSKGEVTLGAIGNRDLVERFLNKFIKEARTLSQLDHSNIIRVLDTFKENNTAYYVMDFIEGSSLEDIVNSKGPLSESVAIDYIKQIASALDYIHQRKLNHLDVKPANIMIRKNDNKATLIDFGVSKQYDSTGEQTSTTPVGISYGYAPIEQYRPGGVVTFSPQADIYALGATLYKLVTRNTPPQAIEIFNDGLSGLPQSLSAKLGSAIRKAMQLKKDERPKSIKEFLNILNDYKTFQEASSFTVSKPSSNETTVLIKSTLPKNEINGHEYVDLGLPSGLKWATCNVGANKPEECGDYFAWGEIKAKRDYCETNYEHHHFKSVFLGIDKTIYNWIGDNISGNQHDAARTHWGNNWRIPTIVEWEELKDKCMWIWVIQDGKSGCKITGPNGNSIFLPASGIRENSSLNNFGRIGDYWSSSTHKHNNSSYNNKKAEGLGFDNSRQWNFATARYNGLTIRPVTN